MKHLILGTLLLFAAQAQQKPAFEVASIKPNTSGSDGGSAGPRGDTWFATNMTVRSLILSAYTPPGTTIRGSQLIGGPDWTATDSFNIEAKPAGDHPKEALQSLLEDRFQLKLHWETRDLPVYNLVLTKRGPKLSDDQTPPDPHQSFLAFVTEGQPLAPLPRGAIRLITGPATTTIQGSAVSIDRILSMLPSRIDRIVLNKTNLRELIDVNLRFRQDQPSTADTDAPALSTALEEIGLKLEPAKAPLPVLVIDSVQHPSQN